MASDFTFRAPGFYEREIDLSERQQAPLGTPAGVIGTSEKGPAFVPVTVGSFDDFVSRFGDVDSKKFGPYMVREFLKHRSAVTYMRVLGAGANDTVEHIERTRTTGQVMSAGFVVTGSARTTNGADPWGGHVGTVQFIVAEHSVANNEAFGLPMFTDNDSVSSTVPKLVRAMIFMASGSRLLVADGDAVLATEFASTDSKDDTATLNASSKFKLLISSSDGAAFATTDGIAGVKAFTASLDPSSTDYIGRLLNTDPESFATAQHLLYADYAVDATIASASSNAGAVAVMSGSAAISSVSGDSTMSFRDMFGHFDTRYRAPITPWIISQPYGTTEYDLFKFESLDDGEYANSKYKISITNIRKSPDPSNEYGTFTVIVRSFDDTDTNQKILEQFANVTLNPTAENYVAKVIGDRKVRFNFDAEADSERRFVLTGKYPVRSSYVRVVMNTAIEELGVPATALPFGFRGYEVLKTNDALVDSGLGGSAARLAGVVSGSLSGAHEFAVVPPIPLRFKVTRGEVATSGPAGSPGPAELANASLHWGVKFERATNALNANLSAEQNRLVKSYTKFVGIRELDALVTGSSADSFNNNKFTLAKVALVNTALSELTASAASHMREAAYIRNASPDTTEYRVSDGVVTNRITLGTLVALTSSVEFNKFSQFSKFSLFMCGGFDGLNILDKEAARMSDKATSFDLDGGAESSYVSPGLNCNASGQETANNAVQSYRTAARIMTDELVSTVNLLAIPGIRESYITDYAAQKVRDFGLAMYVMDVPTYDDSNARIYDQFVTHPDVDKTADSFDSRAVDNNYAAVYFPDVQIEEETTKRRVNVPASVAAMSALAFNDRVAYPWFAPAGFNRASLDFVKNVGTRLNSADRNRLDDSRINPIAPFPRHGFAIYAQKTLQYTKSALDRVNVRRLMIEVKRAVIDSANQLVFENSVPALRLGFVKDVVPKLGLIQTQAGIEKFKVVMDDSNNSEVDEENNRLVGKIIIVPTRTFEKVGIDFIITNSGVEFK